MEEGIKMLIKSILAAGGMGTGLIIASTPDHDAFVQYGALGIIGACCVYVIVKIVPFVINTRKKELGEFLVLLTNERDKSTALIDKLATAFNKELAQNRSEGEKLIRDLNDGILKERITWAQLISVSHTTCDKHVQLLDEIARSLKELKNASHANK